MDAQTTTPGPWFILTGRKEYVNISNATGPHWAGPTYYVGEVRENNAQLVKYAPLMLAALREVYRVTALCFNPTARDIAVSTIAEQVIKKLGETPSIEAVDDDQSFEALLKGYGGSHE